jgi:hypothetical protein
MTHAHDEDENMLSAFPAAPMPGVEGETLAAPTPLHPPSRGTIWYSG